MTMLVSAVMPTRSRRQYAAQALRCFLSQTWPEKELIILDDPDDKSFEIPPEGDNVRYMLADKRLNIPDKRNMLCEAAGGEFIVNFDSDDWSAPDRIKYQVEFMLKEKKAVGGFHRMYFWDEIRSQAWIYKGTVDYVLGTSLIFRRDWWAQNKWDRRYEKASDNVFISRAVGKRQLSMSDMVHLMTGRNHSGNTNARKYGSKWQKVEREMLPAEFFK